MTLGVSAGERSALRLDLRYGGLEGALLLRPLIEHEFKGRIALVSSFGTEAAVLLHMVAEIDPETPVIFLDTGKLFGETLRYRDTLIRQLGLKDVRSITPDPAALSAQDGDGLLSARNPDACCRLRKVEPLQRALAGFDAWITGRKRYQGGARASLPAFERVDGRIKINPLSGWDPARIKSYFAAAGLPRHPLEAEGYPSIGCMPCTNRVAPGAAARSGRWAGRAKSECGIHLPLPAGSAA